MDVLAKRRAMLAQLTPTVVLMSTTSNNQSSSGGGGDASDESAESASSKRETDNDYGITIHSSDIHVQQQQAAEYTGGPCQGKSGCPCKDCAAFASVALPPSAPRTAWDEPQAAAADEEDEESDNDAATKMDGVSEELTTTMAMAAPMSSANDEAPLPACATSAVGAPLVSLRRVACFRGRRVPIV